MVEKLRNRMLMLPGMCAWLVAALLTPAVQAGIESPEPGSLRAGAVAVDITPTQLPVVVSGGFLERTADQIRDPLHCRALVLSDGSTTIAICVVDSLLMPRDLLDRAKQKAQGLTGIAAENILVSATHTHSAPSVVGALGTGVDERYADQLGGWIAESIVAAHDNLRPAQAGWGVTRDSAHTNCRRWIRRPDRIGGDPFGQATIRAMMHPGYQNPDYEGPAGPEDPHLTVLSVQSTDGAPIAVLANYSMHYFGAAPISSDYYGRFCQVLEQQLSSGHEDPPMVAIMSQGTSGDLHWMDYSQPQKSINIDQYATGVADSALQVVRQIKYQRRVPLAMAQRKLTLRRRTPDPDRLSWARQVKQAMEGPVPRSQVEVYACEQIYLHDDPQRELILQAARVGDLGIVAMPCEVYGITGLKIKAQSPLEPTMNFELANGAEGYIPPPEQHFLGGYTTWPARSAGLEVSAEPRIVDTTLELLEQVSGQGRRQPECPSGAYVRAVMKAEPVVYWRMSDLCGPQIHDASGSQTAGVYEDGVAFYLPGPEAAAFAEHWPGNRAVHFAGGRARLKLAELAENYSIEFWFWNALPADARPVTGYLFSRGTDGARGAPGVHLGIGGTHQEGVAQGKLFVYNGDQHADLLIGNTPIELRTWHHLVLVRDGNQVRLYLDGKEQPELTGTLVSGHAANERQLFVGGRSDGLFNFEGKMDELAVYDRALTPGEIAVHFKTANFKTATLKTAELSSQ